MTEVEAMHRLRPDSLTGWTLYSLAKARSRAEEEVEAAVGSRDSKRTVQAQSELRRIQMDVDRILRVMERTKC